MVVWQKMVNFNDKVFEKKKKCINIAYINDDTYNQNFQHRFRHRHNLYIDTQTCLIIKWKERILKGG